MGRGGLGGGTEESETQTEPVTQPTCSSQVALVVKNLPANAGDGGSVPGSGRPPGEGHGTPLPYPCLETPTDRGA